MSANFKGKITDLKTYKDNGQRKFLYKTSYFKEIQEVKVINYNKETFTALNIEINPKNNHVADWIAEYHRFGSQVNFHETMEDAKLFIRNQLFLKIEKLNSDLNKYTSIFKEL
jgi:hypothetical protein